MTQEHLDRGGRPEGVHNDKTRTIREIVELLERASRRELEITLAFLRSLLRE